MSPHSTSRTKVAITGLGIVSCLGQTKEEVTASLQGGQSGIILDQERRDLGFRSALTGSIPNFSPREKGMNRKMLRTMDEPAQYAYSATVDAIQDAGFSLRDCHRERWGIVFGNDSTVKPAIEAIDVMREKGETHYIGSGYIFRAMNSTVTMNLATYLGIRGANWTLSAACASSAHALGQAYMLIQSGLQDVVISGGAQEINWQSMASFDALKAFSLCQEEPTRASRPFDKNRDGLVPSGGAASLIVEDYHHAQQRGARIYGTIEGYGFSSSSGGHLSEPDSEGSKRAIEMALAQANLTADKINYINAHATSTPAGDRAEAQAIYQVFGSKVPVSSTKSMTGHECWMAGASEVLYTILMAQGGFMAPNINYQDPDPELPEIQIISQSTPAKIEWALSNSFGFGGTNASLVLKF